MSAILKSLLDKSSDNKERIVPLLGLHGIGKSSLARNTLHYVAERKMFSGGVLYIQMKNMRSFFAVVKIIMSNIMRLIDLNTEEKLMLEEQRLTHEQMIDYFIDLFNNNHSFKLKK